MSRSLPTAGARTRLRWLLATTVVALAGASSTFAQTPGCQITYTAPTWVGGNGFGATIDIRNTGPTINGWNLVFNFPNGQRIQNGWPVNFSQPAGSPTVTVSSNAAWNATINTNATFNVGFNGTFSGTNNPPTAFTLNGTACTTGGPQNTAPTVSLTAPTNGQVFPTGTTSVNLAANASDPGGAVTRVEFRVDGALVGTDTSSPYSFTATGLAAGNHTAQATAFDNGNPSLSTATAAVPFSITGTSNTAPVVSVTSPTAAQNFATGATVPLTATASDPGGAVVRCEFRVDGNLVATDTTSPYSFNLTGLANGSHSLV
ncbi:MAG TPA: Ig-like domain-containing protein, partial [Steroidobacteraceae bacterium]|nr:Ig-like domain-containing protein [Steroidobacteraceae bacterium]